MLTPTLTALLIVGQASLHAMTAHAPRPADTQVDELVAEVRYDASAREVSNWRDESAGALNPALAVILASAFGVERPIVTRCVKLNNYWCIKSAKWNGEIGKDTEGHVGFATAGHGADAAATLLRRYYMDFGRKSALDVVRRWAPAECNLFNGLGGVVLAVRGIGGTVRAKYLASKRVRITASGGKRGQGRVSISIPLARPTYRVPDIAAGMGEKPKPKPPAPTIAPRRPATRTAAAAPSTTCAPDETRLRNYASRMVEPLGIGPNDDLKLFDAEGTPGPNLAPVMLAMSGFELGILRPDPALIEDAVKRAGEAAAAKKAQTP
jgi:hypothetical protein